MSNMFAIIEIGSNNTNTHIYKDEANYTTLGYYTNKNKYGRGIENT